MIPPIDTRILIHEDNEGAVKMAKTRFSSRRTRHVDMKHHVIRNVIDEGVGQVEYVRYRKEHVDILTKALDVKTFEKHTRFVLNSP